MGSRLALVALSLSFFAGCGGAADTDLLGTPPNGNGVDAGTDVTTAKDTGRDNDVPDVTPPPIDAAPDIVVPPSSSIACGAASNPPKKCDAVTEVCCRTGTVSPFNYDCIADATNCMNSGDVPITCSNHENCVAQGLTGNVCCASLISGGTGTVAYDVSCTPQAKCTSGNAKAIVCNPNAGNPCPNGGSCKLSAQPLPGYYLCF